jgi:hypothetical protein
MIAKLKLIALSAAVLCAMAAPSAQAVVTLSGQYLLTSSATQVGAATWQFDYSVSNVNQTAGGQTGFDGFSIFVPVGASVVTSTAPAPYAGSPGYWSQGSGATLDLRGDGSQNLVAANGYNVYTWWGQNTQSVYQVGSTAVFSITLSNVSAGQNTIGMSSYFGGAAVPTGQAFASNQYGNYTTFTASGNSPLAPVPEPETYAMLLTGMVMLGAAARRRQRAAAQLPASRR